MPGKAGEATGPRGIQITTVALSTTFKYLHLYPQITAALASVEKPLSSAQQSMQSLNTS